MTPIWTLIFHVYRFTQAKSLFRNTIWLESSLDMTFSDYSVSFGHTDIPVVPHKAVPEVSKGKVYITRRKNVPIGSYRNWLWLVEHFPFDVHFPFDFASDPFCWWLEQGSLEAVRCCLTTKYCKVRSSTPPCLKYYKVVLRTTKYYTVILRTTQYYARYYKVLQVLQSTTKYDSVLQSITPYLQVKALQRKNTTKYDAVLKSTTE